MVVTVYLGKYFRWSKSNDFYHLFNCSSVLCFLPPWISGLLRNFAGSVKVSAEATPITDGCFMVSAFCNPLIYSIRKRDLRASVKSLLRRFGQFGGDRNVIGINNWKLKNSLCWKKVLQEMTWYQETGAPNDVFPQIDLKLLRGGGAAERLYAPSSIPSLNATELAFFSVVASSTPRWRL